jgi:hypothetical protein
VTESYRFTEVEPEPENGRHARTAIGVAGLPRNSLVEIQMVCAAGATRSAFEDVGTRGIHSVSHR